MATSTEQINDLIGGYTNLKAFFEGAQAQIETGLNAFAYRVGDSQRSVYIDQVNGDNTDSGLADAPVQTLQAAVDVWPNYDNL